MGYAETFELNGDHIKTTVTYDEKEIVKHISSFLSSCTTNNETKVIGFDAEWFIRCANVSGVFSQSTCATIQLCDGNSCLIIQLCRCLQYDQPSLFSSSSSRSKSLVNFLQLPNVIFVGVGIKENFAKLEKLYHFVCRNAVELGQLAATAMKKPRLNFCGVDELAFLVNGLDLRKHRPMTTDYDYNCNPLSKELAKLCTLNVYSYYKIGSTLLQCDVVAGRKGDLPVHLW